LLGLLNSNIANFFFRQRFSGNNHIASNQLARIPVPDCDSKNHDNLVSLVEQMLNLHKKLAAAKLDHEKNTLQRQIASTDKQIEELVYELYGLTEEERKIVEGQNA
jgi:predicted  nucleic acid-binding Zn-ribbon protein